MIAKKATGRPVASQKYAPPPSEKGRRERKRSGRKLIKKTEKNEAKKKRFLVSNEKYQKQKYQINRITVALLSLN